MASLQICSWLEESALNALAFHLSSCLGTSRFQLQVAVASTGNGEKDIGSCLELFVVGDVVGGGVQLGDDDAVVVLEGLPQLLPDRLQLLAVAAPEGGHTHPH